LSQWVHQFNDAAPPSRENIEDALEDFGLYHDFTTAIRMYAEYKNNKRYWYPGAGVDQPNEYWADIATMNWLTLWHEHVKPFSESLAIFDDSEREDIIDRLRKGGLPLG
jgi:hypothetical protein